MIELSDQDFFLRLNSFEDSFVERKSTGDTKDLLKTAVAFANSAPVGYPAILFYGVKNDGTIEGKADLDSLQKTISGKLAEAYPAIFYLSKVLTKDGKQCLAVIIPGSENRPHFAGHSYVREGSKTLTASEEQFDRLIAERNNIAYALREWIGRIITVQRGIGFHRDSMELLDCNQFYVILKPLVGDFKECHPLSRIEIAHDLEKNRLEIRLEL